MEGNKSYLMYFILFVIIGIIVVFFVIPNGGNKVLECHMENDETGIMTYWDVEVIYENGKMSKVNNLVKLSLYIIPQVILLLSIVFKWLNRHVLYKLFLTLFFILSIGIICYCILAEFKI